MTVIQKVDGICFGCDVVQKIDANLATAKCACDGNILPLLSLDAFRIGRLAHRLGTGYYVHYAMLEVVSNLPQNKPIDYRNSRDVFRKDGTKHTFALETSSTLRSQSVDILHVPEKPKHRVAYRKVVSRPDCRSASEMKSFQQFRSSVVL